MNIRIRKKQIRRKLAAGYPISHNEMKFGIKHKMTEDVFNDPFILVGFCAKEAGISAMQTLNRVAKVAAMVDRSYAECASILKENYSPDLLEVLDNYD